VTLASCPPWGGRSLQFSLPGLTARISGLSDYQHDALQADYATFCTGDDDSHALEISARCFDSFSPPDSTSLTLDGQYAPLKSAVQPGGSFDLTGSNFQARLFTDDDTTSLVGVREEDEFAQANVFENVLRVLMAHRALRMHGALLHSAGIVYHDQAYIFCGRSNAGKTTLSRKAQAEGYGILSDDINLVLPQGGTYRAHAVPFTGEFGRGPDQPQRGSFPVAAIVLLRQGPKASVKPVSVASASASLLAGCPFVNTDSNETDATMDAVTALARNTPVVQLTSAREDSFGAIMSLITGALAPRAASAQTQVQTQVQSQAQPQTHTQTQPL